MIQPKPCCFIAIRGGARLLSGHPFTAVRKASLPIAAASLAFSLSLSAVDTRAQTPSGPPSGRCPEAAELAVLPSPVAPWKGAPLRVVLALEKPLQGELTLVAPNGAVAAKSTERHGGPQYFW